MEHFSCIPFIPDKKTVMRRLGSMKAVFSAELDTEIDAYLRSAQSTFTVRGKALVVPMRISDEGLLFIAETLIESEQLARMLSKSTEAYLMCASIPKREVEKINAAMTTGEGLKAIVYDAYASEFVDGALDVIIAKKNASLIRMRQHLTKHRFSAGYGDLDIKYQKVFYDLLEMNTLDVELSDTYLLSPEKSVIAVAGVE
jgi:hypothetical protein